MRNLKKAPEGKYRVIEIDEYEQGFSTVETDFTEVVKDCDTLQEAERVVGGVKRESLLRLIYDENGDCLGQFRLGVVTR